MTRSVTDQVPAGSTGPGTRIRPVTAVRGSATGPAVCQDVARDPDDGQLSGCSTPRQACPICVSITRSAPLSVL
ncbi:hypothetical protein Q0Z83_024760 [Actinoplanes sichuanensis]|nr:hypothetical protein Q0Z83_024760 [Actinoplanes sichuanensis]